VKSKGPIKNKPSKSIASGALNIFDNKGSRPLLVALGLIAFICLVVFRDFLFSGKLYLFKDIGSDTLDIFYPIICGISDHLHQHMLPTWTFNFGMGQNIFPSLLNDPFNLLVYFGNRESIMHLMIYKELAKILLVGLMFFYYIRALKLLNYTAITGSLFASFCSYMVIGSAWYVFSTDVFNFVLLLLSFELLFSGRKWFLFPVAIFFIAASQPFNLYVYGLFIAGYALFRHLHAQPFNAKTLGILYLQMAGLSAVGLLLSAPFLAESLAQMLHSARGSGSYSYANNLSHSSLFSLPGGEESGTAILRFFSGDLAGTGSDFKGWTNYLEAPMFYCGLPCLLLMPQVFSFLDKRLKKTFIVFISIIVLPLFFPYLRHALWLFSGDYYRAYALFVVFTILYYALAALDNIISQRKINLKALIATLVILLILLHLPYSPEQFSADTNLSAFVTAMLVGYTALIYFMSKAGSASYLHYIFLGVIVVELSFLSNISVNSRDALTTAELAEKTGYNDYTVEALKYISDHDHSFYHIDKTYASAPTIHYSYNDGMVQGYRGTSAYHSFNQPGFINYLQLMGLVTSEKDIRWAGSFDDRFILESINTVKYMLAKKDINQMWEYVCDPPVTFGGLRLYHNKFALPLGFTYSRFIKNSDFRKLSDYQKDFVSLKACVVDDNDVNKITGLPEFSLRDTLPVGPFDIEAYRRDILTLGKDTLTPELFNETTIKGRINSTAGKMMYLSVPADGGWHLKVDGKTQERIVLSSGMTGIYLPKGAHTIEMNFELQYAGKAAILSLLGMLAYCGLLLRKRKTAN
jgi:hypothetical protein